MFSESLPLRARMSLEPPLRSGSSPIGKDSIYEGMVRHAMLTTPRHGAITESTVPDTYVQSSSFTVEGLASDAFSVVEVSGREAISELFRFEIDVVSNNYEIPLATLAGSDSTLTITRLERARKVHGMLEGIELQSATPQGQYMYRAVVVPRLARLALTRQNRAHGTSEPVSVQDVLEEKLTANGFIVSSTAGAPNSGDVRLQLTQTYPKRDYVVQYDETDFAFVSRLCEHYGLFYFFTHDTGRDVVVFGDSRMAFPSIAGAGSVSYRPVSGLSNASSASVYRFSGRSALVPEKVCLCDYNYRRPNLSLKVHESVDPDGHGVVTDYGSNFRTPEEGRSLARVRAQELASHKISFEGGSDSVQLIAGAVFDLSDHFRDDFNAGYLVTWIEHEATQALPGISEFGGRAQETAYRNRFGCLPKSVEFRPARNTPKPRMAGLLNAVIDATGSGRRAELDELGRYLVQPYFDPGDGASDRVSQHTRKAEPYGGAANGMHFPLLKGAEVVLAHVNGDPDRPVIVGAMQNEVQRSVVTSGNNTRNRIRTPSEASFEIEDGPGVEVGASSYARLHVAEPTETYWRIGSAPAPDDLVETADKRPDIPGPNGDTQAGGDGIVEYSAGDRSSLIAGCSYRHTAVDHLSCATNNVSVSTSAYRSLSRTLLLKTTKAPLDSTSKPESELEGDSGDLLMDVAGDLKYRTNGNVISSIEGTKSEVVAESASNVTKGADVSQTWGSTADFMMGSAVAMVLGSQIEMSMGTSISIAGALSVEMTMGMSYEMKFGPQFEFATSEAVDMRTAGTITSKSTDIETTQAKIGAAPVQLLSSALSFTEEKLSATETGAKVVKGITAFF